MSKKSVILLACLVLVPFVIYFLWPSDESRIKKLLGEESRSIEKKDIDAVMSKVSFNYRDDYGMTYLYVKKTLKAVFKRMSNIQVESEDLKITVKEDTATAEVGVSIIATIGAETGYVLGDAANPARLRISLEKERAKWLVAKVEGLPYKY